jgi:hypothetical protein
VDVEYLIGVDHLECHLNNSIIKNQNLKLENWEKLNGQSFHTMGCELIINDCEIRETSYTAYIYQTKHTPSEPLIRVDLWFDMELSLKVFPPTQSYLTPILLERDINKIHIKNPSIFLSTISGLLLTDPNVVSILSFYA